MENRGNILNLDVGNLKKSSFGFVKVVKKGRFKYYVTCGEVVELSMMQFFKYLYYVVRNLYGIIGFILALIGIISIALGITILLPSWVWVIIGIIALLYAHFLVYDKVRKELDKFGNPVLGAISELESEVIKLGGQSITMAELFRKVGKGFLGEGMRPDNIPNPNNIYGIVEESDKEEWKEAWVKLIKRLELSKLIDYKDYPHPFRNTRYIRIKLTSLGASVLNKLGKSLRSR